MAITTTPSCRPSTCPPWLQAALTDIEQRVRELAVGGGAAADAPDSFGERAENYYRKRPQLISLLSDLHNRYLYLADRYSQSLLKPQHHRRHSSAVSSVDDDEEDDNTPVTLTADSVSDAESSLSFQQLNAPDPSGLGLGLDEVMTELVMATVEKEIAVNEMEESDRRRSESCRKIELQRSLVEVLESERMVLLGENARVGYRAMAAEEEARGMAAEAGYMRKRAGEMARMVVKLREDHQVCLLGRKIEGLQAQIYRLERRNRECVDAVERREVEKGEARMEVERLQAENRRLREEARRRRRCRRRRRSGEAGWWDRVVGRIEWVRCGGPQGKASNGCFLW